MPKLTKKQRYQKKYYQANKTKLAARSKVYYYTNRLIRIQKQKEYADAHREEIREKRALKYYETRIARLINNKNKHNRLYRKLKKQGLIN